MQDKLPAPVQAGVRAIRRVAPGPVPVEAPTVAALEEGRPWWRRFGLWFPLAVWFATRVTTAVITVVAQRNEIALPWSNGIIRIMFPTGTAPGYWTVMSNWDGQWYQQIATTGYPHVLPRASDGTVDMSAWAFYPVYPFLVKGLMAVTGLPFPVAGGVVNLVLGAVGMVLLFRLVDQAVGRWEAVVAVVGVCTFISAPILQATYTESLAVVVVVSLLMLLRARRYWWVAVGLVVLALSRNIVASMAPVVLTHLLVRWRTEDELPRRTKVGLLLMTLWAGALTALWPAIIGVATGVPTAYTQTLEAWKVGSDIKLYSWWTYLVAAYGWVGPVFGVVAVVVFAWFMLTHRTWRWGPEIWAWAGAYPAYQLLVTNSGPSRLRYAILAFPFTLLIAWFLQVRWWRRWRVLLLCLVAVLGVGQQAWYVSNFIVVSHLDGNVYYP